MSPSLILTPIAFVTFAVLFESVSDFDALEASVRFQIRAAGRLEPGCFGAFWAPHFCCPSIDRG